MLSIENGRNLNCGGKMQCNFEEKCNSVIVRQLSYCVQTLLEILKYVEDDCVSDVEERVQDFDCLLPSPPYWQVVLTVTPPFSHLLTIPPAQSGKLSSREMLIFCSEETREEWEVILSGQQGDWLYVSQAKLTDQYFPDSVKSTQFSWARLHKFSASLLTVCPGESTVGSIGSRGCRGWTGLAGDWLDLARWRIGWVLSWVSAVRWKFSVVGGDGTRLSHCSSY